MKRAQGSTPRHKLARTCVRQRPRACHVLQRRSQKTGQEPERTASSPPRLSRLQCKSAEDAGKKVWNDESARQLLAEEQGSGQRKQVSCAFGVAQCSRRHWLLQGKVRKVPAECLGGGCVVCAMGEESRYGPPAGVSRSKPKGVLLRMHDGGRVVDLQASCEQRQAGEECGDCQNGRSVMLDEHTNIPASMLEQSLKMALRLQNARCYQRIAIF
jgi:hypothetical protein